MSQLPITIVGTVVHGLKLGKKYNLPPTINIEITNKYEKSKECTIFHVLEHGIYCVRIRRTDKAIQTLFHGVAHYGPRPAVNAPDSFEIHIFDFNEDWYGVHVEVEVLHLIRKVQNFSSIELLRQQIDSDITTAREYFLHK